jgi:hypothetical protein
MVTDAAQPINEPPTGGEWIARGFRQNITGLGSAWLVHKDFPNVSVSADNLPAAVASWLWSHREATDGLVFTFRQLYGLDPMPEIRTDHTSSSATSMTMAS